MVMLSEREFLKQVETQKVSTSSALVPPLPPFLGQSASSIPKYSALVRMQSMDCGWTLSLMKNWFLASGLQAWPAHTIRMSSTSTCHDWQTHEIPSVHESESP